MNVKEVYLHELTQKEQIEVNGGFVAGLLACIAVIGAIVYIWDEAGPQIVKGFKEGYASTQN